VKPSGSAAFHWATKNRREIVVDDTAPVGFCIRRQTRPKLFQQRRIVGAYSDPDAEADHGKRSDPIQSVEIVEARRAPAASQSRCRSEIEHHVTGPLVVSRAIIRQSCDMIRSRVPVLGCVNGIVRPSRRGDHEAVEKNAALESSTTGPRSDQEFVRWPVVHRRSLSATVNTDSQAAALRPVPI
jgi:hypothetical protein